MTPSTANPHAEVAATNANAAGDGKKGTAIASGGSVVPMMNRSQALANAVNSGSANRRR